MWPRALVILCLAAGGFCLEASLDRALDQVLVETKLEARLELQRLVFQRSYPYSFLWGRVTVSPGLRCSQAWVADLTTLHRNGSAAIGSRDELLVISGGLTLGNMSFGFDNCELVLEPLGAVASTKFWGRAGSNSLSLSVALRLENGQCRANLTGVTSRAEDVRLSTGPGFVDWARDRILTQLIRFFHEDFTQSLNSEIFKYLKPLVESPGFCKGSFTKVMYSGVHF